MSHTGITFVIWGGRRGDIWVGSSADRLYQERARLRATVRRLSAEVGVALGTPIREVAQAMASLAVDMPNILAAAARLGKPA